MILCTFILQSPGALSYSAQFIFFSLFPYDTVGFYVNFMYASNICLAILCRTEMKTKTASSTMVSALILALLVFVGEVPGGLALPSTTAPAFLWSPHLDDEYERALF